MLVWINKEILMLKLHQCKYIFDYILDKLLFDKIISKNDYLLMFLIYI